jgi:hypothetical protein
MYVDWVRRAHQDGLRLMVALVINDELLASAFGGSNYSDRSVIEHQVREMKEFAARHPKLPKLAMLLTLFTKSDSDEFPMY